MSLFNSFKNKFESVFFRGGTKTQAVTGSSGKVMVSMSNARLSQFFSFLHDLDTEKDKRYADYKVMLNDAITRAAVKLFVEDATQTDPVRNTTVWVKCPNDKAFENASNYFLQNVVQVDKVIRSIAFYTAAYGDCFLNAFTSDPAYLKENIVGEFFEVEPPMEIMEVQKFGKPCGYYVRDKTKGSSRTISQKIVDPSNFIHFSLNQGFMSQKIEIPYRDDVTGLDSKEIYLAVLGESLLESARGDFRLRQLFDFLLVLSRYNKSSFYRLFGVEVGDADAKDAGDILKSFTDNIETRRSMDLFLGVLNQQAAPMQTGGNVYYTTRDGRGNVSVNTVGGDTDVRGIADINYFDDRYYGALSVPKQFLGQAEETPGGLGDTTLTRLDIKYGRTVKTLQSALRNGFTDLLYWKAENVDRAVPPSFQVCMTPISTVDDDALKVASQEKLERLKSILDVIKDLDLDEEGLNKKAVARYLVRNFSEEKGLEDIMFKPDLPEEDVSSNEEEESRPSPGGFSDMEDFEDLDMGERMFP